MKFPRRSANAELDRVSAAHLAAAQARRGAEAEVAARKSAVTAAREAVRAAAVEDQLDADGDGGRTERAQRALGKAEDAVANLDPSADPEVHRRVAERREAALHAFVNERYHDVAQELLPHAAQAARRVEDALRAVLDAADEWSAVEARFARLLTIASGRSATEVARPAHAAVRDEVNRVLAAGVNEPLPRAPMFLSDNRDDSGDDSGDRDTIAAA